MDDLISRKALCDYALNQKDKSVTPNDIMRFPSAQTDVTDINVGDTISRQAVIDTVHKSIFDFFDICDDDEESPMTYKDEQLLKLNKAITTRIKALPSAQPYTEADIQKMQDLEQAQLDKAYELGRQSAQPMQRRGNWYDVGSLSCRCSECGCKSPKEYSYCPNCGADMREGGEDDS